MAALIVSLFVPVVRTSRAAQADQIVKSFLFTSQQFLGLGLTSVDRKEISLCLRTKSAHQVSSLSLDSEWIDPARFRVSSTPAFASASSDANLAICTLSVSRSVNHD